MSKKLEFGKCKLSIEVVSGTTSVIVRDLPENSNTNLGDRISDEDMGDVITEISFESVESVELLISALLVVRKNLNDKQEEENMKIVRETLRLKSGMA